MEFTVWLVDIKRIPFYNDLTNNEYEDLHEEYQEWCQKNGKEVLN